MDTGGRQGGHRAIGYAAAAAGVAVMTAILYAIPGAVRITNISMLYLLVVFAAALGFGSGPAILASVGAALAFDFFFVPPLNSFAAFDPSQWLSLLMFLTTAV